MKKYLLFALSAAAIFTACNDKETKSTKLKDGKWHAEFNAQDNQIPFVFEVENSAIDSLTIVTLLNGSERVPLKGISYSGDTVIIPIESYDTELRGVISGDTLKGTFRRLFSEDDKGVEFVAVGGARPRFEAKGTTTVSLAGKWDIEFISDDKVSNNVGIFDLKDGVVTGSILTNSGDLRFLEGVIDKDGFRLSAFAGLSPYLIQGQFIDENNFEGEFITSRGTQKLKGVRNENASLADPYNQIQLKPGNLTLNFKLPTVDGKEISLSDPQFKDKVVVVSILGSWCPNCLDEMEFLSPWYKENKDRGVEVIGISFERKDDTEYVNKVLGNLVKKYNTSYPILIGGKIGNEANALPEIDKLSSYPTTFFIDKKGKVRKIHAGFNGPATGLFYDEFKKDFNQQINDLLAE